MSVHPVFTVDPVKLASYLNKKVNIDTKSGYVFTGYVKTIDPVSESVVLVNLDLESLELTDVKIIMGHEVKSMTIVEEAEEENGPKIREVIEKLFMPEEDSKDPKEIESRKKSVVSWLRTNLIPVEEKDEQLVLLGGVLTIQPPYGIQDCLSDNPMVLEKVRGLLESVPPPQVLSDGID